MIDFLAACLRGEEIAWPRGLSAQAFLDEAGLHGVESLLHEAWRDGRLRVRGLPDEAGDLLTQSAQHEAALELTAPGWTDGLLGALESRAVPSLILKGAALAYDGTYRHPHLRPRADIDLLVPEDRGEAARAELGALGYEFPNAVSGRFLSAEFSGMKVDRHGVTRIVDVHWRLSNAQGFARVLSFEELLERSLPLPALSPRARGPAPIDALLIGCMHRIAHRHADYWFGERAHRGDRLIWLYDLHLLAGGLDPAGWAEFCDRAAARGLCTVSLDGLRRANALLGTRIPAEAVGKLEAGAGEIAAAYLSGGTLRWLATDLRALPDWTSRLQLLREHAFPTGAYMLASYGKQAPLWLPALYLHRGARGAWKMLAGGLRWKSFLALQGWERRVLLLALFMLPTVALALRLVGLRRLQPMLSRKGGGDKPQAPARDELDRAVHLARLVAAAARHGLYRATCLPVALTLGWLLDRQGIESALRLGVRKVDGRLEAHAWLECQGIPLIDGPDIGDRFAALPAGAVRRELPSS